MSYITTIFYILFSLINNFSLIKYGKDFYIIYYEDNHAGYCFNVISREIVHSFDGYLEPKPYNKKTYEFIFNNEHYLLVCLYDVRWDHPYIINLSSKKPDYYNYNFYFYLKKTMCDTNDVKIAMLDFQSLSEDEKKCYLHPPDTVLFGNQNVSKLNHINRPGLCFSSFFVLNYTRLDTDSWAIFCLD